MAGYIYRSAITGRFVSKAYAEDHPDTTYAVRRKQSTTTKETT